MTIGSGLAIASIWLAVSICSFNKRIESVHIYLIIVLAAITSIVIAAGYGS